MAIKRGSKVESSFGSASMTDLMFLLIIFFMVTTTMINPNALKLMLPKSSNQLKDKAITTVSITGNLDYYIETTPVSFNDLEAGLRNRLAGEENPTISLHCDKTVPIDEVVKVMNITKDNHYTLILATSPN